MVFQIGNYYQHNSGQTIHIIGTANTFFYGNGLLAEDDEGRLSRVGNDETSATNYHQVSGWPRHIYDGNNIPEPIPRSTVSDVVESGCGSVAN